MIRPTSTITPEQYEAACRRIVDAGQLYMAQLVSYDAVTPHYCAIGALLNGPEGFDAETIEGFDRATVNAQLPDEALARLSTVYGLDRIAIDAIINANDTAEPEARTFAVLAVLTSMVGSTL